MSNIMILGSGGFGCALAVLCEKKGHTVTLWSPFEDEIAVLKRDKEHKKLLAGVPLSDEIVMTTDISLSKDNELIIFAVPSFAIRKTASLLKPFIKDGIVIANVAKGIEDETFLRLSEVIKSELPNISCVALSGPSHAEEVGRGLATTVVSASTSLEAAEFVQDLLMSSNFRIYTSTDIIGVELGATIKNVIALSAGILDGIGLGDNAKAALITRGIAEISRLGAVMGANRQTFAGLTGIGDLIVTCTSMHSRNRRAGILIGKGVSPEDAVKEIGTVEGYYAAKLVHELAKKHSVEMPISEECYNILYKQKDPQNAIRDLMQRPKTHETEEDFMDMKS